MQRTTAKAAGFSCAIVCAAFACSLMVSAGAAGAAGLGRPTAVNAASGTSVREAGLVIRPTSGEAPLAIPAGTGATVTSSITLENTTADTRFEVRLAVGEVGGTAAPPDDAAIGGAASWLTTAATVITLEPGTTRDVPVTVVVPRGAAVGPNRAGITVSIERSTLTTSGLVGGGEGASETLPVDIEVTGDSVGDLVILGVAAREDDDGPTLAVRVWNRGSATVAGYGALTYGSRQDAFEIPEVGPRAELEQRVPWSPGDERRRVSVYVTFGEGRVAQWSGTIDPTSTDEPITGSPGGTGTVKPDTTGDNETNGSVGPARRSERSVPLFLRALVGAAVVIPGWFLAAELLRRRRRRVLPSEEVANAPPVVDGVDRETMQRAPGWARSLAPGGDPTMHQQLDRIALALEQLATVMVPGESPTETAHETARPTEPARVATPAITSRSPRSSHTERNPVDRSVEPAAAEPASGSATTTVTEPATTADATPDATTDATTVAEPATEPASEPGTEPATEPAHTPANTPAVTTMLTPMPMPAPEIIPTPDPVTTSRWIRSEVDALITRLTVASVDELTEVVSPAAAGAAPAAPATEQVTPAAARPEPARRRRRPAPKAPTPPAAPPAGPELAAPASAEHAPATEDTEAPQTPAQLLAAVLQAPVDPEADAEFVARIRSEVRSLVDHLHPTSASGATDPDGSGSGSGSGSGDASAIAGADDVSPANGTTTETDPEIATTVGGEAGSDVGSRAADAEAEMLASIRAQIQAMVNEVEATVRPAQTGDTSTATDTPIPAEVREH